MKLKLQYPIFFSFLFSYLNDGISMDLIVIMLYYYFYYYY